MNASHKWSVAAVVLLGPALAIMDSTIVSVILPQLQQAFHSDFETITWVASAYFLAEAAVIPVVGYLSDHFGSRTVFLTNLTLFTLGSLLCGLAPTKEMLIAFRVLQGIGGGALIPMAYAISFRIFPPDERSKLTAVMSIPLLIAPTFGPTIGGYLSTYFGWNAVFFVNVPIGIVDLILAFLVLPGRQSDGSNDHKGSLQTSSPGIIARMKRFDIPGLLLSIVGVTTLVYGINQAGSKGWGDPTVLATLLTGAVVLVVFAVVELRVSDPILNLRLFMDSTFAISNLLIWFVMSVLIGGVFLFPLFWENVQGNTPLVAGSLLIGPGIALGGSMSVSGLLYNRLGPRILALLGLFLLVSGSYGLIQINVSTTGQDMQFWLIIRAIGVGFVYQSAQTLALSVVTNKGMARASSLVSVTRQMTTAAVVAVLTTYLTQQTTTHAAEISNALQAGLQTHQFTGLAAHCIQVAGSTQNLAALNTCIGQYATATGIADTLWIPLILGAACIPLALVIGHDPAIQALKQAKVSGEKTHSVSIPRVISRLSANGQEIMGSEILLWCSPENSIANDFQVTVESNHFCIVRSDSGILALHEAGLHTVQTSASPLYGLTQLSFSGLPTSRKYEVFYVNRAKFPIRTSGVALSRAMAEVDYSVAYSIHIATVEDAILFVERIPPCDQPLGINVREIIKQLDSIAIYEMEKMMRMGPQWIQKRDFSQMMHQRIQGFLSDYGMTPDEVKVLVTQRDEGRQTSTSLKAFALSDFEKEALRREPQKVGGTGQFKVIASRTGQLRNI